jgi:predicted ester cyclase
MNDVSENDLPALCAAVGFLTINWSLMERQMDNIIQFSFSTLGGIPGRDRKPSAFRDKAKYLAEAFNHNKELSIHKAIAIPLIERAKAFSITRHAFTHGAIEKLDGTVLTINKLQTKGEYRSESIKIDFIDFPTLSLEIVGLVTEWLSLSKTLFYEHQKRKQLHALHR